ncbi:protein cutoff-like [Drosophila bipectinata]|uniref:protein cutoff-like n=1 Tax=Drosophila bipectinata TaxID=42026 RepID=UPI0007E783EC|nr:protein cutoff-like [Drosophila bipectinata]
MEPSHIHKVFVDVDQLLSTLLEENVQKLSPSAMGFFSVDRDHDFYNDASQLGLIKMPEAQKYPLDMNKEMHPKYSKKYKHIYEDYLDPLLQYMIANPTRFFAAKEDGQGVLETIKMVTQGELLQELMCTPYNHTENWRIVATRYKNTSYMCLDVPDGADNAKQRRLNNHEGVLKRIIHNGGEEPLLKFWENYSQYKNVFLGKLDEDVSILYDAPMGGARITDKFADSPLELSNLRFMDFRLGCCVFDSSIHTVKNSSRCYEPMEALGWWSECYLKQVNHIYVGCCNPLGCVNCLRTATPSRLIHQNSKAWSPSYCHMFLANTLREMMKEMEGTDDSCVTMEFNYVAEERKIYVSKEANRVPLLSHQYVQMMETDE